MKNSYSLTEILDWMWQVELKSSVEPSDSEDLFDFEDSEFLQEDF